MRFYLVALRLKNLVKKLSTKNKIKIGCGAVCAVVFADLVKIRNLVLCGSEHPSKNEGNTDFQLGQLLSRLAVHYTPQFIDRHAQSILNSLHLADIPGILSIPLLMVGSSMVDLGSWYVYCQLKSAQHMITVREKFVKDYYKGKRPPIGSPFDPSNFWMRFSKEVATNRLGLLASVLFQVYLMSLAIVIFSKGSDQVIKNPYDDDPSLSGEDNHSSNVKEKDLTEMLWSVNNSDPYTWLTIAIIFSTPAFFRRDPRGFVLFPVTCLLTYVAGHISIGYGLIGVAWLGCVFVNMKVANHFWMSRVLSKEQLGNLERLYKGHFERIANIYKLKK